MESQGRVAQAFRLFCFSLQARGDDTTEGRHRGVTVTRHEKEKAEPAPLKTKGCATRLTTLEYFRSISEQTVQFRHVLSQNRPKSTWTRIFSSRNSNLCKTLSVTRTESRVP
jgi:hypothetical protein